MSTNTPLPSLPGLTPPQQAIATAIDQLCPRFNPTTGATEDLRLRCTELVVDSIERPGGTPELRQGLLQMAPEEIVTQGSNAVKTSNMQFGHVGARLAALRGGATGLSIRGLTSTFTPPPILVASLASDAGPGGAMSNSPDRLSRLGLFVDGEFTFGDKDATSREAGFDFRSAGATIGVDYRFTRQFVLGGAFNYGSSAVDLDADGGDLDTKSYALSLYGTYYVSNAWYIDGIFTQGWSDYDSTRHIAYTIPGLSGAPVAVNQTARGDTDGHQFAFSFGSGYDWHTGALTFGPYARLNYIRVDIDAFEERIRNNQNGFGLALAFENQDIESFTTIVGGQASYALSLPWGVLVPQLRVEWEHELLYDRRTLVARFVADPSREAINLVTDKPDRDFMNVGAALSMVFAGEKAAFLSYQTVLGLRDITAHNIVLGLRLAF
ncbi:MAG: autotransporter outer membrane beta-barrel domain-containing protein [Candidatus Tectimicrobiota bacterium]